jgi:hypothetical protein
LEGPGALGAMLIVRVQDFSFVMRVFNCRKLRLLPSEYN